MHTLTHINAHTHRFLPSVGLWVIICEPHCHRLEASLAVAFRGGVAIRPIQMPTCRLCRTYYSDTRGKVNKVYEWRTSMFRFGACSANTSEAAFLNNIQGFFLIREM